MGAMSERRRLLLKLVIQEYIEHSVPVASELLVKKYGLNVSSATVRNELAALEELGYLTHWHTSAGRVPTDIGYRYFVENLMERIPLPVTEQRTIQHQFYQVRSELLDQWIHLAGAVLARTAQNASVVTPPRSYQSRFKHIELIAIHESIILMVLVLHDGNIRQQTITLDSALSQDELSRTAQRLNDRLFENGVPKIEALVQSESADPPLYELERQVIELVLRAMRQIEEQFNNEIHTDGLIEVLNQPEFMQVERVRQMVEILQGGRDLTPLIARVLSSNDGVQVVIGGEHGQDEMREYSFVLARYGTSDNVAGVLGIVGPTRMSYPRTISAVHYISTVMSDMLGDMYGNEPRTT